MFDMRYQCFEGENGFLKAFLWISSFARCHFLYIIISIIEKMKENANLLVIDGDEEQYNTDNSQHHDNNTTK